MNIIEAISSYKSPEAVFAYNSAEKYLAKEIYDDIFAKYGTIGPIDVAVVSGVINYISDKEKDDNFIKDYIDDNIEAIENVPYFSALSTFDDYLDYPDFVAINNIFYTTYLLKYIILTYMAVITNGKVSKRDAETYFELTDPDLMFFGFFILKNHPCGLKLSKESYYSFFDNLVGVSNELERIVNINNKSDISVLLSNAQGTQMSFMINLLLRKYWYLEDPYHILFDLMKTISTYDRPGLRKNEELCDKILKQYVDKDINKDYIKNFNSSIKPYFYRAIIYNKLYNLYYGEISFIDFEVADCVYHNCEINITPEPRFVDEFDKNDTTIKINKNYYESISTKRFNSYAMEFCINYNVERRFVRYYIFNFIQANSESENVDKINMETDKITLELYIKRSDNINDIPIDIRDGVISVFRGEITPNQFKNNIGIKTD